MFNIDYFELLFLAEVCIPPQPIARTAFFESLINVHFHKMNENEKKQMFETITSNPKFDINNELCKHFHCRYDPDNQYLIHYSHGYEDIAYKYNDIFHIRINVFIPEEHLSSVKISKIENHEY
jgi:hypothetical protein